MLRKSILKKSISVLAVLLMVFPIINLYRCAAAVNNIESYQYADIYTQDFEKETEEGDFEGIDLIEKEDAITGYKNEVKIGHGNKNNYLELSTNFCGDCYAQSLFDHLSGAIILEADFCISGSENAAVQLFYLRQSLNATKINSAL